MNYRKMAQSIRKERMALWIEAGRPIVMYMGKPRQDGPAARIFANDNPFMWKPWDDLYLEEIMEQFVRNIGIIKQP